MSETRTQFILYLCPRGPLSDQIEEYFAETKAKIGTNTAHGYMPHCTLTGFFWDDPANAHHYVQALERCVAAVMPTSAEVTIPSLMQRAEWIGLEMQAPAVRRWVTGFVYQAESPGLREHIRMKSWYHLSLAYGFDAAVFEPLCEMTTMIDIGAPVNWELALFDRDQNQNWRCHWRSNLT